MAASDSKTSETASSEQDKSPDVCALLIAIDAFAMRGSTLLKGVDGEGFDTVAAMSGGLPRSYRLVRALRKLIAAKQRLRKARRVLLKASR